MNPITFMRLRGRNLLVVLVGLVSGVSMAMGSYEVAGLKCEYAINPLGIDSPAPRLFWQVVSETPGQRQTAWQVLAATSAGLLEPGLADLWDSGKVDTDQTTHVPYVGAPLQSSQQVYWKVRSWDKDGVPSRWSGPANWTMGQLRSGDWKGKWIKAATESESVLLRREFNAASGLKRALLHISGLGHYQLFLNGRQVSQNPLTPGWTSYDKTTLYDTVDITADLASGANVMGVHLGNGMYRVERRDRFSKFEGSFGQKRLIADVLLEYQDGRMEVVSTDEGWLTHPGPLTFSNIYGGEDHDARLLPDHWAQESGSDDGWTAAVAATDASLETLKGHDSASNPLRVIEVRQPVATRSLAAPGGILYDFGQNTSYMPRLTVSGPRGSSIILTPGELVYPDGYVRRSSMGGVHRGFSSMRYTKGTDGVETWTPAFFYIGSRYFQTQAVAANDGGPMPVIESLEGLVVYADADPVGEFQTSNQLINEIRQLVRWAQCSNMVSVLTDCPHREKLGWLEQYHLNGPAIRYEFDVNRIFTKGMNDMADSQTEDGLIPNIAPEYTRFRGTFRAAAEWGAAFILVPWQQYLFSGDITLIGRHYDSMKRYFAYLEAQAEDDILTEGLGDWYDLGPRGSGRAQLTLPPLTATAFFHYDAKILAAMAEILGNEEDAKHFSTRAEAIRKRFNETFYYEEGGYYGENSQAANAIPLVMGIVEAGNRGRVLSNLVDDVVNRGYSMTAGDVGFRFLIKALAEGGRNDVIYQMINHQRNPGYGYVLLMGATAMTESWDASPTHSNNHFMLGHITEWFYNDLLGIGSIENSPGFKRIRIHPSPAEGLDWAEGSYDSLHGPIKVRWENQDADFMLDVSIPANTSGEVWLPARAGQHVMVNGLPLEKATDVRFIREQNGYIVLDARSGTYDFRVGN